MQLMFCICYLLCFSDTFNWYTKLYKQLLISFPLVLDDMAILTLPYLIVKLQILCYAIQGI